MLSREKLVHALEGKKVAFGRFWLVELVGRKMVIGISNSFYAVIAPLFAPIPNVIQIGQKNTDVDFGWSGW